MPVISVGVLILGIAGCASSPRFTKDRSTQTPPTKNHPGTGKSKPLTAMEGIASFYGKEFHGKKTANGETYDMYSLTAAHRSFPFGTKVKVTNLENRRTVVVRVNDRGPFKLERIMDLSYAAASQLGMVSSGTAKVSLEIVEWGADEYVP